MVKIAPSVLACDFSRLGEEVAAMEQAGADMIHLDVMDGHFVPNISFGAPVIASLKGGTGLQADVHLMITDPLAYIDDFIRAGADHISIHLECASPIAQTLERIRSSGASAGLVLKPDTAAEELEPYLELVGMVLVMTVEPGFGGQAFRPEMLPKIARIRQMAVRRNPGLDIQVDGGIDMRTAPDAARHGANVLVAGSALFSQPDYGRAVRELRRAAQGGQGPA